MTLLTRDFVCGRLAIQNRTSYRIVGTTRNGMIRSDELLELINKARRGIREPLTDLPSDLVTPDAAAAELGVVTKRQLHNWTCRRHKSVPPHFRFNKQTTRYSLRLLREWLEDGARRKTA